MTLLLTAIPHKSAKIITFALLSSTLLLSAGCQSLQSSQNHNNGTPTAPTETLNNFNITGKIGVTMPINTDADSETNTTVQGGSAFYAWGQQDKRFAIELIGALGIGKTNIEYDGKTATLISEKTGTLTADSPETLLQKATGWQAPISQMPYWISGRAAPSDSATQIDAQQRLLSAVNGDWNTSFTYKGQDKLPSKISAVQASGHKVIMTINHLNP